MDGRLGGELHCQRRRDSEVAEQEGALVEPFAPQPAGDFVVALAGVAGPARGRDVVEGVAPTAGQRLDTVTLQRRRCIRNLGVHTSRGRMAVTKARHREKP